jgi:hypothetical protein
MREPLKDWRDIGVVPESKLNNLRFMGILILVCFVLAVGFIVYGVYALRRDQPSLHWPTVRGTMLQVDVSYNHSRHGRDVSGNLQVTYSYIVDGTRHLSDQIALWGEGVDDAGDFANEHPRNSSVEVYYDPQDPANSVLVPGADEMTNYMQIYGGVILIPLTTFSFFRTRKQYAQLIAQCCDNARNEPA